MSSEAVAKSVGGSMFHTCQNDVSRITASTKVLQLMIENFGAARLFGKENIHFFTSQTNTGMAVKEKMRFELQYNPNDPNLRECGSVSL